MMISSNIYWVVLTSALGSLEPITKTGIFPLSYLLEQTAKLETYSSLT